MVNPDVATWPDLQVEPYYGTQYRLRVLTPTELEVRARPAWLLRLDPTSRSVLIHVPSLAPYFCARLPQTYANAPRHPELHLPLPNAFIPSNLDVLRAKPATALDASLPPPSHPRVVLQTPVTTLWFKADDTFFVPKATVNVLIAKYVQGAWAGPDAGGERVACRARVQGRMQGARAGPRAGPRLRPCAGLCVGPRAGTMHLTGCPCSTDPPPPSNPVRTPRTPCLAARWCSCRRRQRRS